MRCINCGLLTVEKYMFYPLAIWRIGQWPIEFDSPIEFWMIFNSSVRNDQRVSHEKSPSNPIESPLNPLIKSAFANRFFSIFSALPAPGPNLRHHLRRQAAGLRDEDLVDLVEGGGFQWSHPETMVGLGISISWGQNGGVGCFGAGMIHQPKTMGIFDGISPTRRFDGFFGTNIEGFQQKWAIWWDMMGYISLN